MDKENIQNYIYTKKKFKEMFNINIDEFSNKVKKGLIDVEINHNTSWVRDLYKKNVNNLDDQALFYRGTKVTYRELFANAEKYANIFSRMGVDETSEVPMCMSNCPEFIYSIMGLNLLGAKINSFGEFDTNYITEIINDCNSNFLICTDDRYSSISSSINNSKTNNIVMFSLTDSLKNGIDPYLELDKAYYDFQNKVLSYQQSNEFIINKEQFLNKYDIKKRKTVMDYNIGNLDTEFLVTYSSGSTNSHRPKAIVHSNRSLITMGRFHDRDLSELPPTKGLIGEMTIPNFSNTSIITSMSDVLYKGCVVAIEPIYNREFLLISLAINKPNFIAVPRNMIVDAAKKIYSDERFKNFKMPYMMMLTSVGEPTSKGEEKFINKMLRKSKAGVDKLPMPLSPVTLSIGGGDCERGGMFFTPYRLLQDLNPKFSLTGSRCGLKRYAMVQLKIVDNEGKQLPPNTFGRLLVKTPTMMKYYKNNKEATEQFFIKDFNGDIWTDCNVYATLDKNETIEILERIGKEIILSNGQKLPLFCIGKEIEKDTKHILSYEVVNLDNDVVIHLEFQPGTKNNPKTILNGIRKRIENKYGAELAEKLIYRIRDFEEGFVGTCCEKRDYISLYNEGITENCIKVIDENNEIHLVPVIEQKKLIKK